LLPPIAVDCTRCAHQFLSRAQRHAVVRCPRCKHPVRVKRPGTAGQAGDGDDGVAYVYDSAGQLVPGSWSEDGRLLPARATPQLLPGPQAAHSPAAMTWAGALEALGWRLTPLGGGCEITISGAPCGEYATRHITGGWACDQHYFQLVARIIGKQL
jgi:DNA-directed RNA polymerase subunit RPC12/RpoP